jgi:uncharacterized protein YndB with AHSA1/START domain
MAEILHRVGVNSPMQRVYETLLRPEGISLWWTRKVTGISEPGSVLEMRFKGDSLIMQMRVEEAHAPTLIRWRVLKGPPEWIGTGISFELKANAGETVVLFKHEGWKEPVEFMHHCSTKWGYYMLSLKSLLEDGHGTPHPDERPASSWG